MYMTRSQTRAANFVGICSKRATTGSSTPGGIRRRRSPGSPVTIAAQPLERGVVARPLVARVEDHEAAVLEVVDPAVGDGRVVRARRTAPGSGPAAAG